MARYIGPKSKIARKFGEAIYGADKVLEKRNYPPGQHGLARKRKKNSEYGEQLSEKQKAKYTYGILEKQFARTYEAAARMGGITGENLLKLPGGYHDVCFGFVEKPLRMVGVGWRHVERQVPAEARARGDSREHQGAAYRRVVL